MGWLVVLGIITLLAVLPLGVSVKYDEGGAVVKLIAGPLKITLFPRPKKEKKPQKEKTPVQAENPEKQPEVAPEEPKKVASEQEKRTEQLPAAEAPKEEKPALDAAKGENPAAEPEKKSSGGPITDFLPLVKTALEMLGAFRRRLRVNVLEVKVIMAGDDPADLAINYGRAWAAIGNLQPQLEKFLVIKKRKIEVECDFCASQTLIAARLDLTITLGRILATVFVYGIRAVIQFLKINKKRKGGAAK